MLSYLQANLATIIISILLILMVAAIIRYLWNNHKQGINLCGHKCSECPSGCAGSCASCAGGCGGTGKA